MAVMDAASYRLSELGWLQFERLIELAVAPTDAQSALRWMWRADQGRVLLIPGAQSFSLGELELNGRLAVVVLWSRPSGNPAQIAVRQTVEILSRLAAAIDGAIPDRFAVVTNLDAGEFREAWSARSNPVSELVGAVGARELSELLDDRADLRAALPSVLGVRDLGPLISDDLVNRSSIDLDAARTLASVFWSTSAYQRARDVLARHRFVVLTGPPEMGKTAIARMIGLAQMTDGWEVHECTSPDALWRVYDAGRRQVFIADDAFGSTEYRPDAAEAWAETLSRLLATLDDTHLLIWTSRPAPLKAGLDRVQREQGMNRFPAPGDVLVDASELDLSEKTLILFRHAKAHDATQTARQIVQSTALQIVEHLYFTPERIRRLVSDRIDALAATAEGGVDYQFIGAQLELELTTPTEAMGNSFRALDEEHREILIALLDVPAGLIGERELASTLRRHHPGGMSRPMHELVDRLTDHFLRVTPLGIGWVHPSWRDLVIDELAEAVAQRQRFLSTASIEGVTLALSGGGGSSGQRSLPLLQVDGDWDRLSQRVRELTGELEDREIARLLLALTEALSGSLSSHERTEARHLSSEFLETVTRHSRHQPMSPFLIEAWFALQAVVLPQIEAPDIAWTWAEMYPSHPRDRALDRGELHQLDEWLGLVETLAKYAPRMLREFGFFTAPQTLVTDVIAALEKTTEPDLRPIAQTILDRLRRLAPRHWDTAGDALLSLDVRSQWWEPTDIAAPPTLEPVRREPVAFAREDVARVLRDLDPN
jgi:hypothetical protein